MVAGVLDLTGKEKAIRDTIEFRVAHEDCVVHRDDGLDRFAMNTERQFAGETMVDIHAIQLGQTSETAPERRTETP